MQHFYEDVPGLGNVAVSRHAQSKAMAQSLSEDLFRRILHDGKETPDGMDVLFREGWGFRLVIVKRPTPYRGAMLVTTVYRVLANERVAP